jgi:signal transduction histidine kinase
MVHTSFICFTFGYGIAIYDHVCHQLSTLMLIDSIVAICLTTCYLLTLLKKISKKNAMLFLSYLVVINVIVSGFIFMANPNFDANISHAVNLIFIVLFVMPFTTSRSHALIVNIVTTAFLFVLAFISDDKFLWNRLTGMIVFLNGIGLTCITFSKLVTHFLKSAIESKLKIEELSLYKQKITRLIVHDLKVPASTILNLSSNSQDRSMREINTQVRKINKQLEDILDIERLEEPNMTLDIENIAIDKLVTQAIKSTTALAIKKSIAIVTTFDVYGFLKCDVNLIERTLVNLLSNAIKYSPSNEQIHLSIHADADLCHIIVKDNGPGIPQEQLSKIFDKFYRIKTDKSTSYNSNGLGLSFCKLAVEAHNGHINAASEGIKGNGSKFKISLSNFTITNLKTEYTKKYIHTIHFSKQEELDIANVCNKLLDIPIYKVSDIIQLTQSLSNSSRPNIAQWYDKFTDAVYTGNQNCFNELIEPFMVKEYEPILL